MNDPHPSDRFESKPLSDELLSAYVDGELTGDQLAQVEQRLTDDPQAVQLVEELRALSQDFQALPQQVVGEDLRATILQRAEKAMLLGAEGEQHFSLPRPAHSSRRWAWAGLALAASLLLSVFLPQTQQEEHLQTVAKAVPSGEAGQREREIPAFKSGLPASESSDEGAGKNQSLDTSAPQQELRSSETMLSKDESHSKSIEAASTVLTDSMADVAKSQRAAKPDRGIQNQEPVDSLQLTCMVQVMLSNEAAGREFEKTLAQNGITFCSKDDQSLSTGLAMPEKAAVSAKALSQSKPPPTQNSGPAERLLAATDGDTGEGTLVLVEAHADQIEAVLRACNADTMHCASIRVTEQTSAEVPIDRFRQWDRSGTQWAQSKERKPVDKVRGSAATRSVQGWATRLDASQYPGAPRGSDPQGVVSTRLRASRTQRPEGRTSAIRAETATESVQSPIQVLFILRQAADATAPAAVPDKPATTHEESGNGESGR